MKYIRDSFFWSNISIYLPITTFPCTVFLRVCVCVCVCVSVTHCCRSVCWKPLSAGGWRCRAPRERAAPHGPSSPPPPACSSAAHSDAPPHCATRGRHCQRHYSVREGGKGACWRAGGSPHLFDLVGQGSMDVLQEVPSVLGTIEPVPQAGCPLLQLFHTFHQGIPFSLNLNTRAIIQQYYYYYSGGLWYFVALSYGAVLWYNILACDLVLSSGAHIPV